MAVGYGVWGPSARMSDPMCCAGVISNVILNQNERHQTTEWPPNQVLYQTDCVIHKGNSGGILVDPNGSLLGIVAFNVTLTTKSKGPKSGKQIINYPTINYALPVEWLLPIASFIATNDPRYLLKYDSFDNARVQSIWNLNSDPPHPLFSKRTVKKLLARL